MVCNNCGTVNDAEAKFCSGCGASLAAQEENVQAYTPAYQPAPTQNPNYYNPAQNQAPAAEPGKGLAIAGMVCGIVSFFCFAVITGALGIIFGAIAKNKGCKSGMATAGIACGVCGIALWLLMLMFGISLTGMIGY